MRKRVIIIISSLLYALSGMAQNETKRWYFGRNVGLDFTGGPPVVTTTSSMNTTEGCTSISDASGNLLFYTLGDTVWNANHQMMPNGDSLLGHWSSTQSALIVKKPGSATQYYIFCTGGQAGFLGGYSGLSYSVVDMALQSGLGDVISKNNLLLPNTCEKLTATLHCNGTDAWVMVHEFGTNAFYAYPVTSSGVGAPVVTNIGPIMATGFGNATTLGQMKFSPNGRKLATVTYAFQIPSCLLDFDPSTGILSNPINIPMNGYGVEFSPDGTKLYFAAQQISTTNWGVYQFDLCAPNIPASQVLVSNNPYEDVQSLQLAPDDKIYVARWNSFGPGYNLALACINSPDVQGLACTYVDSAIYLNGRESGFGLPGFVTSFFYHPPQFTSTTVCLYDTTWFTIRCNTDIWDSVRWNFNDPPSGINNTSASVNPGHIFTAPGNYNVQLIVYFECRTDTVYNVVTVNAPPALSLSANDTICTGNSATLTATGNSVSYSWTPSTGLNTTTGSAVTASPTSSITYNVIGTSAAGCMDTASVSVTVVAPPLAAVSGNTTICSGNSATLTGSGGPLFSWSNGATTASITVNPTVTTTYTLTVSNSGCSDTAAFTLTVVSGVNAAIMGTNTICTGSSATLTGSGLGSYSWSTGATTTAINVSPTATTTYTLIVTSGTCADTASFTVTVVPPPSVSISGNSPVCPGSTTTLSASGAASYSWSSGATTQSVNITPTATTTYTVIGSNGVCTDTASITINTLNAPAANAGNDATISIGNYTTLSGSGGGTYNWSPATGLSCTACPNPTASPTATTTYYLTVTDANGCQNTDTVTVYVSLNCNAAEGEIFIPDVFSPNHDGNNDVLYVRGGGMKSIAFSVYDRWGNRVFESSSQDMGWDGTFKGKELDPGVYIYVLTVTCYSDEDFIFKGNITLLR
ncbi:MAG: gliding motility-associated C-terminal domain-containing protein [Bacteroidota bacterium]